MNQYFFRKLIPAPPAMPALLWRWSCIALLLSILCTTRAHAQQINIVSQRTALSQVLESIAKQAGRQLLFDNSKINVHEKVQVELTNVPLEAALQQVLPAGYTYTFMDNYIVIKTKQHLSVSSAISTEILTGTVTNSNGEPLPMVNIAQKAGERTIMSNDEGRFRILVSQLPVTLVFSHKGFVTQEKYILKNTDLRVALETAVSGLNEVVVTGYQRFTRREIAGAVTSVKTRDLTQLGAVSIDQMLAGKLAGVSVTGLIGNPGAPPKIRVRGTSSITGDQEPIWVVDGVIWEDPVPIRNRDLATQDEVSLLNMAGGSIAGLNPKDIESIDVLKDAAATAIYGVRAANGVIVVTTRRGQSGAPRINYSTDLQVRSRPGYNQLDLMSAGERLRFSEQLYNANILLPVRSSEIGYEGALLDLFNKKINRTQFDERIAKLAAMNTDWFKELFRNSFSNNHTLSISGGTDNTTYLFSGGYYNENANAIGQGLKRYNGSLRINTQLSKRLTADIRIGANIRENQGAHKSINPYAYAFSTSRAIPVRKDDGSPFFYAVSNTGSGGNYSYNILNELNTTGNESKDRELSAMLNLRYAISNKLNWETIASYNTTSTTANQWATDQSLYTSKLRGYPYGAFISSSSNFNRSPLPLGGELIQDYMDAWSYTFRNSLQFVETWKQHKLNLLAGNELRSSRYNGYNQTLYGYFPDRGRLVAPAITDGYISYLSGSTYKPIQYRNRISNYVSWYGIANYSFRDRYILNASARSDGSNLFGKDTRFRFEPVWSLAGKWIMSEEPWMQTGSWLSFAALRFSYGWQGNIRSDASPSLVIEKNGVESSTGKYLATVRYLPNPGLRWEKTSSVNLGLEMSLLKDRINLAVDYYHKKGRDLIIDQALSYINGRSTILINDGQMINEGIEWLLTAYPVRKKNINWRTSFNMAHNRNRITRANQLQSNQENKTFSEDLRLNGKAVTTGDAYGTLYSYQFMHLNEKGWPMFMMNDGTIGHMAKSGTAMLVNSGPANPTLSGGWDNQFRYKDLTLTVSFSYSIGGRKRLPGYYNSDFTAFPFEINRNMPKEYLQRWQQPGDEAHATLPVLMDILGLTQGRGPNNSPTENGHVYATSGGIHMHALYNYSNIRVVKTDHIRLQAVNLAYQLPATMFRNTPVKNISVYFSAQNLWFWAADKDKLSGRDPEIIGNETALPLPRIFNFGINASF